MLESQGLPGNIRVPFMYFGVDNSKAGSFTNNTRVLVFGQMLTGTATPNYALQTFGNEDLLFGAASMLSRMIKSVRLNNPMAEIWAMPLTDGAGVKSKHTVTVSGATVSAAETVELLVNGRIYRVTALVTDTDAMIADKLKVAISDDDTSPVTATVAAEVLTLESKNAGEAAGELDIRANYRRLNITEGQIKLAIVETVAGSGTPDCGSGLTNLAEEPFDWVVYPYTDLPSLNLITAEYNDTSGRWNAMSQLYGHVFSAINDTPATRVALGNTLNSQHLSVMGIYGSPTPAYLIASAVAAKSALHLSEPPELSRPLQTIPLEGVMPPEVEDTDDKTIRQTMYLNGIGGVNVQRDGTVVIDRVLTTYHTNAWGVDDNSYLDLQTLAQLQYIIRFLNQKFTQTFPRHALKSDDDPVVAGAKVVTPRMVRNYLAAWGQELSNLVVIEKIEKFIESIIVERSCQDPNTLDIFIDPDLVNQFRIGKVLVSFYNEYPCTTGGAN